MLNALREKRPLVHHITNYVTVSECANITLSIGGLPVMAQDENEVAQMVEAAGALVLNIGTLSPVLVEAMIAAGKKANELNIPVVLDPVGAGATDLRTASSLKILEEVDINFIKGNKAEISILAGSSGKIKGVESIGSYDNISKTAKELSKKYKAIVIVSGEEDIITDGKITYAVKNGHPFMGTVVGTGCMAASIVGCFAGACGLGIESALYALVSYNIAGEIAAENKFVSGPGSFKMALFDAVANLTEEIIEERKRVAVIEGEKEK